MWAIRRVSHPLRNRELCIRASSASLCDSSPPITQTQLSEPEPNRSLSFNAFHRRKNRYSSSGHFLARRDLSSQAGAQGSGEDDDDSNYGFSQDECEYKDEPSKNETQLADAEIDFEQNLPGRRKVAASMLKAMVGTHGFSVRVALDKWVEEGNKFGRGEVYLALSNLRRFGMYGRAVQFLEWLEAGNRMEFTEKDYSALLDSIAKLQGLFKAEQYIEKIPKVFRGELVYRTLLANCVQSNSSDKAEEVFNMMKDMGLPLSMFTCNQLILLYKRTDKKKVADVLLLMENAKLKPNLFTYKLLIDIKGTHNDITGIEALLETMDSDGIKPDWKTKCIVARHYIAAGLKEKVRAVLKEMEGGDRSENHLIYGALLELYAELGDSEEVGRVWKECEESPSSGQFVMAIRAWGKLNEIEKAESVFESMLKVLERPNSLHYDSLLRVYADNKMLKKGRDHVQRMADNGIEIGPMFLDTLVKLYMEAGMIEKADEILHKATQQSHSKQILFRSYMAIMDRYADRGDIHNAEKIFRKMRESGYTARFNQFQALIRAYVVAEAPAYGMRERMKADKLFPNKFLAAQLVKLDSYEMKRNPQLILV